MIYIEYCIKVVMIIVFKLICYLTNPFVVLFADEYGELPVCLRWWQTYDNTLDVEWMITEGVIPKFLRYDYQRHYHYEYEQKGDGYMYPGFVEILDHDFTMIEKLRRYGCRLWWLYRNTGYGFAYEVCGKNYVVLASDVVTYYDNGKGDKCTHIQDDDIFCFYLEKTYYKDFYLRIYVGWKLKGCVDYQNINRAMIAFFVSPFRRIGDD